jgi:class 3 adenylate cyclase
MDIASWLRSLGLERYEAAFRENEIDETVLRGLTSEDLKDLGVGAVGHRRKLLDAIAARHPSAAPEAPPVEVPENAVERRRVTVIFADLVGFTALSVRMDPEDLQSVIGAYHQCVAKTIHSFDGFVASYLGDGALVYFGYPQAHEDDADRAVRASLALIDAVASLPTPEPLQVRIGVATGLVLVGDLIGSGVANKHGIIGETPNLAARLQTLAEPNTVVISESTRKLLGSLFELRDLGPKDLKGIPGPIHAWRALRASSVESRFEALRGSVLTALVGRKEELGLLLRRWAKATTGEGQAVLISGGWHRQIATHRGAARMPCGGTAHVFALLLLAATHRQRILSGHRSVRTRRRAGARRYAANEARQARRDVRADFDLRAGRLALCRDAVAAQ